MEAGTCSVTLGISVRAFVTITIHFFSELLTGLGIVWLVFPHMVQSQALNQELEKYDYGKIIEQIKGQDPRSFGR